MRSLRSEAHRQKEEPVGTRLRKCYAKWKEVSGSKWVHTVIKHGVALEFSKHPRNRKARAVDDCLEKERKIINEEFEQLRKEKIIERVTGHKQHHGVFLTAFVIRRADGIRWRVITDGRPINRYEIPRHFKMEGTKTVQDLLATGDWMTKVDLSNAYYHINVRKKDRCYLRFRWKGQVWQFRSLPMGLSSAPRTFTHVLKEPIRVLRSKGIRLVIYIDDILIMANTKEKAKAHTKSTVHLLKELGFLLKESKCDLVPKQEMVFLGYTINSNNMTFSVPKEKVRAIRKEAKRVATRELTTPRKVAGFIGKIVAHSLALAPAKEKTRELLNWKNKWIRKYKSQWDRLIKLSRKAKKELEWWHRRLQHWNGMAIVERAPTVEVESDASKHGFGGWRKILNKAQKVVTRGFWKSLERTKHNNIRELLAGEYVIKATCQGMQNEVIVWYTDNTTAAAYINAKGGTKTELNFITQRILSWCRQHKIVLQAKHRPGIELPTSDALSRRKDDRHDWMIEATIFKKIDKAFGPHTVDLFASRVTTQTKKYFSRFPDHQAVGVDAFRQSWTEIKGFANPPFALIGRVLRKVKQDQAKITVMTPQWPSAPWWPVVTSMAQKKMIIPKEILKCRKGNWNTENPYQTMRWNAVVWSISCKNSVSKASVKKSLS